MTNPTLTETLLRHLRLRDLHVFLTVLEHGSFGKAASVLHVSQPAVTKAIAGLEALLQVKLFDRGPHGVAVTAHGASLAEHARSMASELRRAASRLDAISRGSSGTLHVGTVPMHAASFLPWAVTRIALAEPDVFVEVTEGQERELSELLRKRAIDVALVRREQFTRRDEFAFEPLFEIRTHVVASRSHPLASRLQVSWQEAADSLWVLPPAESLYVRQVRRALEQADMTMPRTVVESSSFHFRYAMVLSGTMLSFGSRPDPSIARTDEVLVRLPILLPLHRYTIGAATLRAREPAPLAQRLLAEIRARVAPGPLAVAAAPAIDEEPS